TFDTLASYSDRGRRQIMKPILTAFAFLVAGAFLACAEDSGKLEVQIHYKGSGTVDSSHKIFVALWENENFDGGPPSEVKSVTSKDGVVTFPDLQKTPLYVSSAYDPTGNWDAASPPPSGTSIATPRKAPPKSDPITITPGKTAKVEVTFD